MKKLPLIFAFLLLIILIVPGISIAHPGRTDSVGCHTCRTNCSNWGLSTGEYHCHNAKALPQPEEPIKSTYGEQGTGYTTPAPEYKTPAYVAPKQIEKKPAPVVVPPAPVKKEIPKTIEPKYIPAPKAEIKEEIKAETSAPTPVQIPAPIKKKSFWAWLFRF